MHAGAQHLPPLETPARAFTPVVDPAAEAPPDHIFMWNKRTVDPLMLTSAIGGAGFRQPLGPKNTPSPERRKIPPKLAGEDFFQQYRRRADMRLRNEDSVGDVLVDSGQFPSSTAAGRARPEFNRA